MTEQHLNDPVTLYVTVPNKEEGIRIGHVLVKSNLVACANVMDNVTSVFSWQGEIQEEAEAILFAKTRAGLVENATAIIITEHEYECPCVVALPITGGSAEFIDWIKKETQPQTG
jgi:periplasmic divalent cation tolerance protein